MFIQNNFSTGTSGNLIAAFAENPDYQVDSGTQAASNQVFALNGAKSANFWQPITVEARISDRNKWYNVDLGSLQTMNTTQGVFVVVVQNPPNTSTVQSIPIMFRYEIEFTGTAFNNRLVPQLTQYALPEGAIVPVLDGDTVTTAYNWIADKGLTLPNIPTGLYNLSPQFEIGDDIARCVFVPDPFIADTTPLTFYTSTDVFNPTIPLEFALSTGKAQPVSFTTAFGKVF